MCERGNQDVYECISEVSQVCRRTLWCGVSVCAAVYCWGSLIKADRNVMRAGSRAPFSPCVTKLTLFIECVMHRGKSRLP